MKVAPFNLRLREESDSFNFLYSNSEILFAVADSVHENSKLSEKIRYQLLTEGLLITSQRSPSIFSFLREIKDGFDLTDNIELFVSPLERNTASAIKLSENSYAIHLSTNLLNTLNLDEIKFVIAHEVAHIAFGHFDLQRIFADKLPSRLSTKLFEAKRLGEISADLAAASLTNDPSSGRSALSKIAVGGANEHIILNSCADYDQLLEIQSLLEQDSTLFEATCSHPASILRMYVLGLFENSIAGRDIKEEELLLFQSRVDTVVKLSLPENDIKDDWITVLAAFWVAFSDDDFNIHERREVAKLCSKGEFKELYDLCISQDSPEVFLSQQFKESVAAMSLPKCKKAMTLERIVAVAHADGSVSVEEREILEEICSILGLEIRFLLHLLKSFDHLANPKSFD